MEFDKLSANVNLCLQLASQTLKSLQTKQCVHGSYVLKDASTGNWMYTVNSLNNIKGSAIICIENRLLLTVMENELVCILFMCDKGVPLWFLRSTDVDLKMQFNTSDTTKPNGMDRYDVDSNSETDDDTKFNFMLSTGESGEYMEYYTKVLAFLREYRHPEINFLWGN